MGDLQAEAVVATICTGERTATLGSSQAPSGTLSNFLQLGWPLLQGTHGEDQEGAERHQHWDQLQSGHQEENKTLKITSAERGS